MLYGVDRTSGTLNQGLTAARGPVAPKDPIVGDPSDLFGSEDDLLAYLEGWSQQETPSLTQLVEAAPPPPAPHDATFQIEQLVARNPEVFKRDAGQSGNAPLLMTEDHQQFFTCSPNVQLADHNQWHLADDSR